MCEENMNAKFATQCSKPPNIKAATHNMVIIIYLCLNASTAIYINILQNIDSTNIFRRFSFNFEFTILYANSLGNKYMILQPIKLPISIIVTFEISFNVATLDILPVNKSNLHISIDNNAIGNIKAPI